jgi:UDP-N-acetylglucosamine:LPS N-acetylglucosamine transferase
MPQLLTAADLMVSKLGSMFNEAIAAALPIVALEPPPGSERVQHRLLAEWQVGCPVSTLDEMVATVAALLTHPQQLAAMRERARARRKLDAAARIARWLTAATSRSSVAAVMPPTQTDDASLLSGVTC